MTQTWHDLLFAHWPIMPDVLKPLVPPGVEVDTCEGSAWLGLVAFRLSGIRLRRLPEVPFLAGFPGSIEHWLTERYCYYAPGRSGRLYRCDIHHPPWLLQRATADIRTNTMALSHGIELPPAEPLLHYAHLMKAHIWQPRRIA